MFRYFRSPKVIQLLGLSALTIGMAVCFSLAKPTKASALVPTDADYQKYNCGIGDPSGWVNVIVRVKVVHPDGTFHYSNNFKINVEAFDPTPNGFFSQPNTSPYLKEAIFLPKASSDPNNYALGSTSTDVAANNSSAQHIYQCLDFSGTSYVNAYPFNTGINNNYYLNCLQGVPPGTYNVGFRFKALENYDNGGTGATRGYWEGPVQQEVKPVMNPDGTFVYDINGTTNQITFTYHQYANIKVQGRVFNINNSTQGYAGISIKACNNNANPTSATPDVLQTDSNGSFSFPVPENENFCVRVVNPPPGMLGGPFVRPWVFGYGDGTNGSPLCPAYSGTPMTGYCASTSSYEWQVAGANCMWNATDCGAGKIGGSDSVIHFDRNVKFQDVDFGYDFVFVPPASVTQAKCSILQGYAIDTDKPDQILKVRLVRNGNTLSTVDANLSGITPNPPGGSHGFNFANIANYRDAFTENYTVQVENIDATGNRLGWTTLYNNPLDGAPCAPPKCTITPATAIVGSAQTFTVTLDYSGAGSNGRRIFKPGSGTPAYNLDLKIINGSSPLYSSLGQNPASIAPGTTATFTFSANPTIAGTYTTTSLWQKALATNPTLYFAGDSDNDGHGPNNCNDIIVNDYTAPYVKTYGADSFAGTDATCSAWGSNPSAGIYGNNAGTSIGSGSASQLALLSLGAIRGFNSGFAIAPPTSGTTLTLANTASPPGYFGANHCPTDYNSSVPAAALTGGITNTNLDTAGINGTYHLTGTQVFNDHAYRIPNGNKLLLYIDGDLIIGQNITFANTSWSNRIEIPFFTVVVKGNIYIEWSVTRLDGVYISQKTAVSPALPGTIYTCAGFGTPILNTNTQAGLCKNQLIVNGALIANRIKFLRTFGNQSDGTPTEMPGSATRTCVGGSASVCAAEVINFMPEIYLALPPNNAPVTTNQNFDYFTSPPPVF